MTTLSFCDYEGTELFSIQSDAVPPVGTRVEVAGRPDLPWLRVTRVGHWRAVPLRDGGRMVVFVTVEKEAT